MKYFPLVWSGLWRKPVRTAFTLASITIAFILFGLLEGLNAGFAKALAGENVNLLITDLRVPGSEGIPIAALGQIEKIPNVTRVTEQALFMGTYQEPNNVVGALATDPIKWFAMRPEFVISRPALKALAGTPTGMVATPALLDYYGWKVGDKIPLKSTTLQQEGGGEVWIFDLVGTFDARERPRKTYLALINYQYFDDARAFNKGTTDRFIVQLANPHRSVKTAAAIDAVFANSAHETRTRSLQAMAQFRMKQVGDITFLTDAVVSAVLFSLLFLTANTMKQSITERIAEFAVLKTIGMTGLGVAALVVSEAAVLCVASALTGITLAAAIARLTGDILGPVRVSATVAAAAALAALLVAMLSTLPPLWRVNRLRVVDALAVR